MSIVEKVRQYQKMKEQKGLLEKNVKALGEEIKKYAEEHAERDTKGNYYVKDSGFVFGKQCRKSIKLNQEKTLDFVKAKGFNQCVTVKEEVNEEALEELVSTGDITTDELQDLTEEKVTYAIYVANDKDMPEVQQATASVSKKPKLRRKGAK